MAPPLVVRLYSWTVVAASIMSGSSGLHGPASLSAAAAINGIVKLEGGGGGAGYYCNAYTPPTSAIDHGLLATAPYSKHCTHI